MGTIERESEGEELRERERERKGEENGGGEDKERGDKYLDVHKTSTSYTHC